MNKYNILVVEDEEDLKDFLERILLAHYNVWTAENALKAAEILSGQTIHLILSDVMMPDKDGFTFCRELKQDPKYAHIPVVLLTAKNTTNDTIEGLECGADAYMEKPFSNKQLLAQIASILASRHKALEHFVKSPLEGIQSAAISMGDPEFEAALEKVITEKMDDVNLDVDMLARELAMSKSTVYRKIETITKKTPSELINFARLKKASKLLLEDKHKVYEIAYMVGYNSLSSFLRNFQKQYGQSPKQYIQAIKQKDHS